MISINQPYDHYLTYCDIYDTHFALLDTLKVSVLDVREQLFFLITYL